VTRLWALGERVETWDRGDTLAGFVWQGIPHHICEVCNRWRVHTRWWVPGGSVWREYVKVTTDTGLLCQLYRDPAGGEWYLARLYD
jgi:hypothetical protein